MGKQNKEDRNSPKAEDVAKKGGFNILWYPGYILYQTRSPVGKLENSKKLSCS